MNQPVLLGFGDSWTYGAGLSADEKPYIQLAAEQLQIPYLNLGVQSSSLPHLIIQFKKFIETTYFPGNEYHAVFFLTAKERTFVYDQDTREVEHVSPSDKHDYYRIYSDPLGDFNVNTVVLALQRLCSIYNIKDYYLQGWQLNMLWPEVDHTKFWNQGFTCSTNLFHDQYFIDLTDLLNFNNPNFGTVDRHPNQQGHAKIAQALVDWIKLD